MHLKSITLKGFKSFAKKTILNFDEGVTCVVGPNGSGKSNISDALLWVLGERSAKNIRGEAMTDVIFSGSKVAKAANHAEVSILLDNTDGTVNIDYNEVVITRRAYKSGESEYLLNDSKVRRADIIRILSDSGLGQGTHSIISQGSLDSVLSLDEGELRAVIEETAGVLQHKQTKAKTLRKLENLVVNVERINDIIFEVERQLEPLQRKAKRAETYLEIKDELTEARLNLAIDDYRIASNSISKINQKNENLQTLETEVGCKIDEAEEKVSSLTDEIRRVSEIAERKNEQTSAFRKAVDGVELVANTLNSRLDDAASRKRFYDSQIATLEKQAALAQSEMTEFEESYEASASELEDLLKKQADTDSQLKALSAKCKESSDEFAKLEKEKSELEKNIEKTKSEIEEAKSALSGKQTHLAYLGEKRVDIEVSLKSAEEKAASSKEYLNSLKESLSLSEKKDEVCREALAKCASARESAEVALREAKMSEESIIAQIDALTKVAEKQDRESDAFEFQASHPNLSKLRSLGSEISVDVEFEDAVEAILGDRLSSLIAPHMSDVVDIARIIVDDNSDVSLTLLTARDNDGSHTGETLADHVECNNELKPVVQSLLGDVQIIDNLSEAQNSSRALTRDGHFFDRHGEVVLNIAKSKKARGALTRKRQIDEMKESLERAKINTSELSSKVEEALSLLQEAQGKSLLATEEVTKAKLQIETSQTSFDEQNKTLQELQKQLEEINEKIESETVSVEAAQPDIEKRSADLSDLIDKLDKNSKIYSTLEIDLEDLKSKEQGCRAESMKLASEVTMLKERCEYRKAMRDSRSQSVKDSKRRAENLEKNIQTLEDLQETLKRLSAKYSRLLDSALKKQQKIIDADSGKNDASLAYDELAKVREEITLLRNKKDQFSRERSELMVEKTKLDIELQNKIKLIEDNTDLPFLEVIGKDALQNREEVEEREATLSKKMQRLGNIDLSAEKEYRLLKERYDYLARHASDIEQAISAVRRIDTLIEKRFEEQFSATFEDVNENFKKIFSTLFPGGTSEIELVETEGESDCGVSIKANPAGKKISRMSLLSGGERSLTAISFLFALYNTRHTPFYVLDEIEAALDDTNLSRLLAYIENLRHATQFIMITHQRRTMEMADVLFGVSMQEDGITQVISQRLSDFEDDELDA